MIINQFKECGLSGLGMGTMRLPLKGSAPEDIDEELTERIIDRAMAAGVNYYDMAYEYHNGKCEEVIGRILGKYPRDSYYAADKFPGYVEEYAKKPAEIFEDQLRRMGLDHFDFYLLHSVTDDNAPVYLDPEYGIIDYLLKQKECGRIKHLGFSCHISPEGLERFLCAAGQHMEFCQIQLNWLDWTVQEAERKVEIIKAHGLPVWVMEPVRGGKLARLAGDAAGRLNAVRPGTGSVEWCFRFLQSIPEVTMVLSGMNSMQQINDNIGYFEERKPLTDREKEMLLEEGRLMAAGRQVLCTGCRYCIPHCAAGLDIPELIRIYNDLSSASGDPGAAAALDALPDEKKPGRCIGCGMCRRVCPQGIDACGILMKL